MTITRPRSAGTDPITKPAATIRPHAAIGTGLTTTAWIDVQIAVPTLTSRSSSNGKETTLIAKVMTANRKPTPIPTTIMVQPGAVVNTSWMNAAIDAGALGPS